MKKLLLLLQFVFLSTALLYAAPWGTWEDWYERPQETNPAVTQQNVTYSRFNRKITVKQKVQRRWVQGFERVEFLTKAMNGAVKVWVRYNGYNPNEEDRAQYEDIVRQAIQSWFKQAAEMIEDKGRQEEFGEVYQILAKGIEVSFVGRGEGDVNVIFYDDPAEMKKNCRDKVEICAGVYTGTAVHVVRIGEFNDKEVLQTRVTHEFGHAFGLTDQYNVVDEREDYSLRYGSPEESEDSIMNGWAEIGPDDIDGIINVVELELLAQGKPGIPKWWVGFAGKYVYFHGEWREYDPEREEEGFFEEAEPSEMTNFIIEEMRQDKKVPSWKITVYRWVYPAEQAPQRHASQNIVYLSALNNLVDIKKVIEKPLEMEREVTSFSITPGKGPNEETVQCFDRYRKTFCFGELEGRTMWVQRFERAPQKQGNGSKRWMDRKLYFRNADVFVEMMWKYDNNLNLAAFQILEEKLENPFPVFSATLEPEGRTVGNPLVLTIDSENQEPFFLSSDEDIETQMKALMHASPAQVLAPFRRR